MTNLSLPAKVGRKSFYQQLIILGWNEGPRGAKTTKWGTPGHPLEQVAPLLVISNYHIPFQVFETVGDGVEWL